MKLINIISGAFFIITFGSLANQNTTVTTDNAVLDKFPSKLFEDGAKAHIVNILNKENKGFDKVIVEKTIENYFNYGVTSKDKFEKKSIECTESGCLVYVQYPSENYLLESYLQLVNKSFLQVSVLTNTLLLKMALTLPI